MPWTASSVMEERLRFVARLLDGEAMTDVCRDFGVSISSFEMEADVISTPMMGRACVGGRTLKKAKKR